MKIYLNSDLSRRIKNSKHTIDEVAKVCGCSLRALYNYMTGDIRDSLEEPGYDLDEPQELQTEKERYRRACLTGYTVCVEFFKISSAGSKPQHSVLKHQTK